MSKEKIKSFSDLPPSGMYEVVHNLLNKASSVNLGLLFYKLFAFKFARRDLEKGLESKEVSDKLNELLQGMKDRKYPVSPPSVPCDRSFQMKTAYRLAVGMGYPSLLENGFLFHHTYGIPYISGETLKGLARFVLLLSIHEAIKDEPDNELGLSALEEFLVSEEESFKKHSLYEKLEKIKVPVVFSPNSVEIESAHVLFRRLFGAKDKKGQVVFHDAYPKDFKIEDLELDIMNPHYSSYYRDKGKRPPADWENPNPVKFLTLREGVVFRFCLDYEPLGEEEPELLEYAELLLRVGLENFGVGGKKRKGYGWFANL